MDFVDHKINLEQLYQSMETTNPQIKIAELNFQISSVENSIAWSSLLPNFNVAYYKQTRDGNNGFYGAALGISIPLWFLLDQNGKIQESAANQAISESEQHVTKNEVSLMLKNAFTDHENNLQQVKLYVNDILPQAEEIYRTAIKSYDAGELTYLEYLQAKQTLISSRNNYINALFNHFQSVFKIEEMIGKNITDNSGLEN
jgi:cobalt-zinc-cadmium resistance protein CzcA